MSTNKNIFVSLCIALLALLSTTTNAQAVVAADTLSITVNSIVPELNPNINDYTFSFYGSDNTGKSQKVQIRYNSPSMYGTFTNNDFYNWDGSQGTGSYNYIRRTDSDLGFYAFKNELTAIVADSVGATILDVNGLINVYGKWTRVLLHGVIPAPAPDDTISLDLGQATVIPMDQFGYTYLRIDAANPTYSLAFGIAGLNALQAGTYYQSEMLRPDLVQLPDDTIPMSNALLVVTNRTDGYHDLSLDLLSESNILYHISMHTGEVIATDTIEVVCPNGLIQNLTEMYGIYQLAGVSSNYQIAIGLTPGVIEQSQLAFTNDSVSLAHTRILDVAGERLIQIQQASGWFEPDSTAFLPRMLVHADLLAITGTLYRVTFPVGGSQMPVATDTTYVDCGDYVGRLDYTYGAGYLALVVGNEDVDAHVLVYNGLQMTGSFGTDMFVYESEDYQSHITIYNDPNVDYLFSDIQAAEMRMDSIGDTVHIQLNVVTKSLHMFCFTANLLPTYALSDSEVTYTINTPILDDGAMVAIRLDKFGNEQTFRLQFQRSDNWDEEGQPVGDDYEFWNFIFMQDSVDGMGGTYGYSAGTLMEDAFHYIVEHGTEILLAPMAGTLTLNVGSAVTIPAAALGTATDYHTHLYSVQADMVMQNGIIYHLTGTNFLLCIDLITEQWVELSEQVITAIDEVLAPEHMRVKKVLRNGMLLIETTDATYNLHGTRVKAN